MSLQAAVFTRQEVRQAVGRIAGLESVASQLVKADVVDCGEALPMLQAYNLGSAEGYVIMGKAEGEARVVAYSPEGHFDADQMPPAMQYWLSLSAASLDDQNNLPARVAGFPEAVTPLLGTMAWGQDYPFNTTCPTKTDGSHYYVGCVATAATQIMRYHQWPASYDWANMPYAPGQTSVPAAQVAALSALAADFGKAVQMEYLANGSAASSMMVPGALRNTFGYASTVCVHRRDYYSTSQWRQMIYTELAAGRPVFFGATSDNSTSGHAFVCDGYDAQGYIHINWGWYGSSNGYFLLNHLDPSSLGIGGGTGGYNTDQEIITGIAPQPVEGLNQEWPLYASVRFSATDYGNEATFMTIVENFENLDFKGQMGIVAMRQDTLLKVLYQQDTELAGFKDNKSGYMNVWLRNVPIGAIEAGDGPCQIRLAIKPNGREDWQMVRFPFGLPSYAEATVKNGQLDLGDTYKPAPNVVLLEPLNQQGPAYAGGIASLKTRISNLSADFRLSKVVVRLKAVGGSETYDMEQDVKIYDESEEDLSLLVNLPSEIRPGTYDVTLFHKNYEAYPFDNTKVGRMTIEVMDNPGHPVLQLTQAPLWNKATQGSVFCQGDNVSVVGEVRNYGPEGTMPMQCWMTDVNDSTRSYIYQQQAVTAASGKTAVATFYRRMVVDPGTYRFDFRYLLPDGTLQAEAQTFADQSLITVEADTVTRWLEAVELVMPDTLYLKSSVPCSFTVKALDNRFSGTVYVRLRQFTNSNGELAWMGSQAIAAGESKTITFNYKPAVATGTYMVLAECKQGGKDGTIINYPAYYRIITVLPEPSAIDTIAQDADQAETMSYDLLGRPVGEAGAKGLLVRNRKLIYTL